MDAPLIVRLEVDHMRQAILHAFATRQGEIAQLLAAELDRVIRDDAFGAQVREAVRREVRQCVADTMRTVVSRIVWQDTDWQDALAVMAREELAKVFAPQRE